MLESAIDRREGWPCNGGDLGGLQVRRGASLREMGGEGRGQVQAGRVCALGIKRDGGWPLPAFALPDGVVADIRPVGASWRGYERIEPGYWLSP